MLTEEQNRLLLLLATELQRIWNGPPPDKPEKMWPRPPLEMLIGIEAEQIRLALGEPEIPRPSQDSWQWCYHFHRLPKGWRGGGPSIYIRLDSDARCAGIKWRLSR